MTPPTLSPPLRDRTRNLLLLLLTALLVLSQTPVALAAPSVATGGPLTVTEQDPATTIGTGTSISGGTSYDGQYLDFAVGSANADDHLELLTVASPSTVDGVVSVVGSSVYLGDGSQALPIGSVDPTLDGRNGSKLRVNLTSAFGNPSFEDGDLTAWNAIRNRVDLGVDSIAGHRTVDTSTYPFNAPNEDNNAPSYEYDWSVGVTTDGSPTDGTYSLKMSSSMTTKQGCDVVHGPAVYSDSFEAASGDRIYFDWRAYAGGDAYHVFGYILDEHGNQTEVLDDYTTDPSGSSPWTTKETVIPSTGTYRFVFVAGTYDATCYRGAGATLLIDNVRVYGNKVTDAVASAIAEKLTYANTSDDPPASRTVTITAQSAASGSASGDITVNITPVDDPPTLQDPGTVTFTNTADGDTFGDHLGTLSATDPDSTTFTYDADDATGSDWRVVDGTWADLRLHTSGAYVVVPDDAALEGQMTPATETFTLHVHADSLSDAGTLTVQVTIEASPPGAPDITGAASGHEQVDLSWTSDAWLGGSATTDWVVEYSTDGGSTWTSYADGTSTATSTTVTGLVPGVSHVFRVAGVNASGTGDWSTPSEPVVPKTTQEPLDLVAGDLVYGDATDLSATGGSGTGDITYLVDSGPCRLDGTTLSSTGVGTCTLSVTKAGDTTYYEAGDSVTIQVTPRPLTVDGAIVTDRPYDGTTDATIAGATLAGVVDGDDVSLTGATSGQFTQATVGDDLAVTTGMGLTGADTANYTLTQPTLTGTITARQLTVTGATVAAKVYDGTTDAIIEGATLVGVVDGDDVTLADTTSGTFASADAGAAVPVTTGMSLAGGDAGNYALTQPELHGHVGVRALRVEGATVTDRVYDGTTRAGITGATLRGVLDGDDVRLVDHDRGNFVGAAAGDDIAVTTGMSLLGDDAGNYSVLQPTLAGTITQRTVVVTGASVATKVIDGSDAATVVGATPNGFVDGDDVALRDGDSGLYATTEAGTGIPVATAMWLGGGDADNYRLTQPRLTGDIAAAPSLTVPGGSNGGDGTADGSAGSIGDDVTDAGLRPGDEVDTELCNLQPGSQVEIWLEADGDTAGISLGTTTVGDDGCVLATAVLPTTLDAGDHVLSFTGTDQAGGEVSMSRTVSVLGVVLEADDLPDAGAPVARVALLALLLLAVGAAFLAPPRRSWLR